MEFAYNANFSAVFPVLSNSIRNDDFDLHKHDGKSLGFLAFLRMDRTSTFAKSVPRGSKLFYDERTKEANKLAGEGRGQTKINLKEESSSDDPKIFY